MNDKPEMERRSNTIQSISIAARFLNILANSAVPLPLGAIATKTGTGRSTAHRYLQSLIKEGLAMQDPATGLYNLGPVTLKLGVSAMRRIEPISIAARHMRELSQKRAASGGVAIWTDRGPTLVRWYKSADFSISSVGLGDVLPIDNSACGLVFQAFVPSKAVTIAREMQKSHSQAQPPNKETLEKIRDAQWVELTSHLLPNITGQASPVFDAQGEIACVVTTITDLGNIQRPEDRYMLRELATSINQTTCGEAC